MPDESARRDLDDARRIGAIPRNGSKTGAQEEEEGAGLQHSGE
jgi:hypothetical protein